MQTYHFLVSQPKEQTEHPETVEPAHEDGAVGASVERRGGLSPTWAVVALLAVLSVVAAVGVLRLDQLIERTDSLIVEQQRATCYERLQWLGDPSESHPERNDLRAGASRRCEGDSPLIRFDSD